MANSRAIYENRRGLFAQYKAHGSVAAGGTAYDISGNGFNATLSTTLASIDNTGIVLNDGYITLPATGGYNTKGNMGFTSNEDWSICLNYKGTQTGTGAIGYGLLAWGSPDIFAGLVMNDGKVVFAHYDGGWQKNIISTTLINNGSQHNVVYVNHAGNTGDLYIDGVAEITGLDSRIYYAGYCYFQPYHIGRCLIDASSTIVNTFGTFNNVCIFNRALSPEEVKQIYYQTKGLYI